MGFCSLQHSRVRRSTSRGPATPAKFRPQGLATLSAAYSLRARAGSVSHRRRSWDSPFGAFSSRKVSGRFRRNAILTELAARSEFEPVVVPPAWVGRSRFAVGRFLGCAVFLAAGPAATVKQSHEPLFGFRSPPEYYPADPSRPAAASQHLSWAFVPFSTPGLGGPLLAGLPSPLRSARRVWLPSRRLTPSEPVPVLFHTGGALGIHPSERPPPARFPRVSARKDPHTVFPAVVTVAEATGRPGRPRFLGFDPSESPWRRRRVFSTPATGCSLGLLPF
jgi:hypothetical protein